MPLISRNGKLLRTASGLASSLDCCCGGTPCECTSGSLCIPAGQTNHIGPVLVISNVPDEVYAITTNTRYPCTARACSPGSILTEVVTHKISGLSQVNGSYPILYVRYDDTEGEWVEAEPGTGCHYWAFPQIAFVFDWETATVSDHNPIGDTSLACNPLASSTGGSFSTTLDSHSALFSAVSAMDNYIPTTVGLPGNRLVPYSISRRWADCVGSFDPASVSGTVHTNNPFQSTPSANIGYGSFLRSMQPTTFDPPSSWWGPLGGDAAPQSMSGYVVIHESRCELGAEFSDWEYDEVAVSLFNFGSGNCGSSAERYYSQFRITREMLINP